MSTAPSSAMPIQISFDLPFSLNVEGRFVLNIMGDSFDLTLSTVDQPDPKFPGAERVENVAILNDNTNFLSYTNVFTSYLPTNIAQASDPSTYAHTAANIALSISNALISAVRITFEEYHLEYLHTPHRFGPISFTVPAMGDGRAFAGSFDGLQGGITFAHRGRPSHKLNMFAWVLANGATLTPSAELLFEGRRYLLRGNRRMALVNLVISFEINLASKLSKIAAKRNDQSLEQEIAKAALNELGTKLARKTLGHSFAERKFWSDRFSDAFEWLRVARNGILHKAQLILIFSGQTRDFGRADELQALFAEHDWLIEQIEAATAKALKDE